MGTFREIGQLCSTSQVVISYNTHTHIMFEMFQLFIKAKYYLALEIVHINLNAHFRVKGISRCAFFSCVVYSECIFFKLNAVTIL